MPRDVKQTKELGPFERVWQIVAKIPRGRVATYGQISQMIDRRLTPVGVGWAVRAGGERIPWQRVVNASGGISTDDQHEGLQRAILESEGVQFGREGRINLARYGWTPRLAAAKTSRPAKAKAKAKAKTTAKAKAKAETKSRR